MAILATFGALIPSKLMPQMLLHGFVLIHHLALVKDCFWVFFNLFFWGGGVGGGISTIFFPHLIFLPDFDSELSCEASIVS